MAPAGVMTLVSDPFLGYTISPPFICLRLEVCCAEHADS